jgi:peptide/nickel transport system permease protein
MPFARYLLGRGLFALVLVVVVSSSAVVLTLAAPGDFVAEDIGMDPTLLQQRRDLLGLNDARPVQYARWVSRAARFDFGDSLLYTRPVSALIGERARNTAILATSALILATLVGIPLGIYTGSRRRGAVVRVIRAFSILLLSAPPLLASLGLVMLAARTGWLPVGGMVSAAADASWRVWLWDVLQHLSLPALALALPLGAMLERLQSQAMSDAVKEPFVQAAEARGLSRDQAMLRHGWPVSLGAVLGIYGLIIGTLFSGSFIVEVVTAWPGLGRLMYDALRARDLYLVAGCAATGALFLALGTFVSDLLLAAADPRARLGART